MAEQKLVVTHVKPRHYDDYLALAYLSTVLGGPSGMKVLEIDPNDKTELPKYVEDPNVIVLDVGGSYDPQKNNYDHHHDLNVPSSLVLILKHIGKGTMVNHPTVQYIDVSDRFGPQKAQAQFNVPFNRDIAHKGSIVLRTIDPVANGVAIISALKSSENFIDFINKLYTTFQKVVEPIYQAELRDKANKIKEAISKVKTFEFGGFIILYSPVPLESVSNDVVEHFGKEKVGLIVAPNQMNKENTSITRNSFSPTAVNSFDLSRVKSYNRVFLHKNGFLLVVDKPVTEVDPMTIAKEAYVHH